jgi:hypothetical protein
MAARQTKNERDGSSPARPEASSILPLAPAKIALGISMLPAHGGEPGPKSATRWSRS